MFIDSWNGFTQLSFRHRDCSLSTNISRLAALTPASLAVPTFRDSLGLMEGQMRAIRFSSAALMLFFSFACFAQDKTTGAIKGKVRVEKGSPAAVAVILRQGEREVTRTTTDKHGDFLIARVAPGVYSVTFRKPGLSVGSIDDIEVKAGKTRALGDRLVLSVDEGSIAFIRGSVFTEAGRSVPGVRVELARILDENSTQKLDSRVTGETGEFVFRLPPEAAKYRLTLKADGVQPASKDVEVDGAAVYRVALSLKQQ
jgi:hypothetical protein